MSVHEPIGYVEGLSGTIETTVHICQCCFNIVHAFEIGNQDREQYNGEQKQRGAEARFNREENMSDIDLIETLPPKQRKMLPGKVLMVGCKQMIEGVIEGVVVLEEIRSQEVNVQNLNLEKH